MDCCISFKRPVSPSKIKLTDFTIIQLIGKGAFGKVCIVYNKSMQKSYALKYMSKRRLVYKSAAQNVLRELEILRDLTHPFLTNLWFAFQDAKYIYIISDLLLGGNLRFHLSNDSKFSEARVKLYVCEIALALDYLQSRNIIHRDIKPDNILLDQQGHTHLTDFNLAIKLEPNALATSFSGTKPYMSPEIIATYLGHINGYDLRVDWWSLAITFFEFLRGRQPFDFTSNTTLAQMLQMMLNQAFLIPSHWPSDLISFIKALLNTDIEKRITCFTAFRSHRYMTRIDFDSVFERRISPIFVPKNKKLNSDPAYDFEKHLMDSSSLRKHHRRKKRQELHNSTTISGDVLSNDTTVTNQLNEQSTLVEKAILKLSNSFTDYNRFSAGRQQVSSNNLVAATMIDCPQTSEKNNLNVLNCPA